MQQNTTYSFVYLFQPKGEKSAAGDGREQRREKVLEASEWNTKRVDRMPRTALPSVEAVTGQTCPAIQGMQMQGHVTLIHVKLTYVISCCAVLCDLVSCCAMLYSMCQKTRLD